MFGIAHTTSFRVSFICSAAPFFEACRGTLTKTKCHKLSEKKNAIFAVQNSGAMQKCKLFTCLTLTETQKA